MSRPRPQWQLQALAAQRRDTELRRAAELKKIANYFEANTNASRHHEQWTAEGYYERANRDAEILSEKKIRAAKLEERRKKLELMLFQEHTQYQQELKSLASQPKLFKNGYDSYLNNVPTSTLQEINQGIIAKEEALRRQEAELRLHHAWRMNQPELRAAKSYIENGRLKSAWTEQIVEKELQKRKDEEDTRKILMERDEALRKQIQIEEERLKEKELQMKELRNSLEGQIAELSEKEKMVKQLRKEEEKQMMILDELKFITKEREKELARVISERDTYIVNMGLHKYKLKQKVASVIKEIEVDLEMMKKIQQAFIKDLEIQNDKRVAHKRVLDSALQQLEEHRARERQRQKNIETMYDGEARQINEKQDKLWAKEREARALLMTDVVSTLKKQVEEKIEANRLRQRSNVLEREKILEEMDSYHKEVKAKEKETQFQKSAHSNINTLQSELNNLNLKRQQLEEAVSHEANIRANVEHERMIRKEIGRMQRAGTADLVQHGRRHAWS